MNFVHRLGGRLKTSLALVGAGTVAAGYYQYLSLREEQVSGENKKKQVLVIPFHRLQLVERQEKSLRSQITKLDMDKEDRLLTFETRELVDAIHHAASDPDIVALYGIFGHGSQLPMTGWSTLEEVRNALRVFRESHRRHPEPNRQHAMLVIPRVESKPLYAYTDTFSSMGDPANKDYYLASIFTHIHLQNKGELNLFGLLAQNFFLRDLLEKYGITLHVFKHGQYKNFPNMFTEAEFNRAHRENVTNILQDINAQVCSDISAARSKALLTTWLKNSQADLWTRVHNSGTFPALTAWKAGLIDFLPRRDPLLDLVESNKTGKKEDIKQTWNLQETDFDRFTAEETISLQSYAKKVAAKREKDERRFKWQTFLESQPAAATFLSKIGVTIGDGKRKTKETVALLYIDGAIGDTMARKTVNTIRKIRNDADTKCVVVRVSSPGGSIFACETISQELKALKVPVVFSFGNVSASGGYYIASRANRIFANHKTVTGSIGVFGIRMDLTGLAAKYGINVQHVAAGDLSASWNPFHRMTRKMKQNMAGTIDRYYDQFKEVVSEGRFMPKDKVEVIAQGRVWTGEQAKTNGLVDELGGLHRTLAYAQRVYTSGDARVVVWPKKQSFFEMIVEAGSQRDSAKLYALVGELLSVTESTKEIKDLRSETLGDRILHLARSNALPGTLANVMFTLDEHAAIDCMLENMKERPASLPAVAWE